MKSNWVKKLKKLKVGEILENVPAKDLTTYRIGGPVDVVIYPQMGQFLKLMDFIQEENIPYFVLGAGSNLLVSDDGFRGIFINLMKHFNYYCVEKLSVLVGAGKLMNRLIEELEERGLGGIERLYGIPGTMGGAIKMNIRAFDCEIKDFVKDVVMFRDGKLCELMPDELGFAYRHSNVGETDIVLEVRLELEEKAVEDIKKVREKVKALREKKQPLKWPSCGSTFKNPSSVMWAGELIERAGLKGLRHGKAQISSQHANFIINQGDASAHDVIHLIKLVRREVYKKFNILLEPEVKLVGFEEGILD